MISHGADHSSSQKRGRLSLLLGYAKATKARVDGGPPWSSPLEYRDEEMTVETEVIWTIKATEVISCLERRGAHHRKNFFFKSRRNSFSSCYFVEVLRGFSRYLEWRRFLVYSINRCLPSVKPFPGSGEEKEMLCCINAVHSGTGCLVHRNCFLLVSAHSKTLCP